MTRVISFFIVAVIFSQVDLYVRAARIVSLPQGLWSVVVCSLAVAVWASVRGRRPDRDPAASRLYRRSRREMLIWGLMYTIVSVFSYLFAGRNPYTTGSLLMVGSCFVVMAACLCIFVRRRDVRAGQLAMMLVVCISVINNVIDALGIYAFDDTIGKGINFFVNAEGRGAGFYVNPNTAGLYLVVGMILSVAVVRRSLRLPFCLLVGLGVVATFSRSSLLMWLIALFGLSQINLFKARRSVLMVMWAGLVSFVLAMQLGGAIISAFHLEEKLPPYLVERLHFDSKVDKSVQDRVYVASRSWELFKKAPVLGHGIGATKVAQTRVEPHNMYLLEGLELGIIGIVMYLTLFVLIWRTGSPFARVLVPTLVAGSFFSSDILDNSSMWLALALLSGMQESQPAAVALAAVSKVPLRQSAAGSRSRIIG